MSTFNANFYVTAATIIPVLYLALTLQGNTYRDLMTRWRKINRESSSKFLPQARATIVGIAAVIGAGVILQGALGEFAALRALLNDKAVANTQSIVFDACVALLIMVTIGPVWWFLEAFFGSLTDDFWAAARGKLGKIFPRLNKLVPPTDPADSDQSERERSGPEG